MTNVIAPADDPRPLSTPIVSPGGEAESYSKPYKGPESYRVEDADLFFGRDRDAERVLATALSSRFTLLHAPSGAGKSSLLNARVIPGLEIRGWLAVRATPGDDPTTEVRRRTIDQVLPPPQAEIHVLRQASRYLLPGVSDPPLGDLLASYRALPTRNERRRELAAPVKVDYPSTAASSPFTGPVTPFATRLLRGSIDVSRFAEHVRALTWQTGVSLDVDLSTPVGALIATLSAGAVTAEFDRLVRHLAEFPLFGLRPFFQELADEWGQRHTMFAVVLILDQFEELFTRFVDTGAIAASESGPSLDWRLRKEFFNEMERLYAAPNGDEGPPLPIRCVVSIRNEFIASLDDLRRIAPDLAQSTIHLDFLRREDAADAMRQPAEDFGYGYDPALFDDVLLKLTREGAYVEPAQLQVVCDKLWKASGAALSRQSPGRSGGHPLPVVEFGTYRDLGFTQGILQGFFREYLDTLSDADRLETLEMLEPLITSSGTRNIAEWRQLVAAPFRDQARREQLLKDLERRTIVRFEARLGGRLVEVTHEFLIPAIQKAIVEEAGRSVENIGFRQALRTLDGYRYQDFRADPTRLLKPDEIGNLHANRERIVWPPWAIELMFRSAIVRGSDTETLLQWATRYQAAVAAQPRGKRITEALAAAGLLGRTLSRDELDAVNAQRDSLSLTPDETETVLRSALRQGNERDRDDVLYWTTRVVALKGEASTLRTLEGFARSAEVVSRCNAARALQALETRTAAPQLVKLAVSDESPQVRACALLEIGRLDDEGSSMAGDLFGAALRSDDASARRSAYSALGRLRSEGVRLHVGPIGARGHVQLADRARPLRELGLGGGARIGAIGPALAGAAAGVLVSIGYLVWVFGWAAAPELLSVQALAVLLALLTAFAACGLAQPIGLQFFHHTAVLLELVRATVAPVTLFAIGLILYATQQDATLAAVGAWLALTMGLTRIGSLVPHDPAASAARNRCLQVVAGSAFGIVGSTFAVDWWTRAGISASDTPALSLWPYTLPVVVAIAAAGAWIDGRAPAVQAALPGQRRRSGTNPIGGLVAVLSAAAVVLSAGIAGARVREGRSVVDIDTRGTIMPPGATAPAVGSVPPGFRIATDRSHVRIAFGMPDSASTLIAYIPGGAVDTVRRFGAGLRDTAGAPVFQAQPSSVPSFVGAPGRRGVFRLTVEDTATTPPARIFAALAYRLGARRFRDAVAPPAVIAVGLAPTDSMPVHGTVVSALEGAVVARSAADSNVTGAALADLAWQLAVFEGVPNAIGQLHPVAAERVALVIERAVAYGMLRPTPDASPVEMMSPTRWIAACSHVLDLHFYALRATCDLAASSRMASALQLRGIYRARTGEFEGAYDDFRRSISPPIHPVSAGSSPREGGLDSAVVSGWADAVRQHRNPFTPELLHTLRTSGQFSIDHAKGPQP